MSTGRLLIGTFGNHLNVFCYSLADWILCILLYFVNLNCYNGLYRANNSVVRECFHNRSGESVVQIST